MRLLIALLFANILFAEHFVSFVIPCYNCEKWIDQAISSIYNQHLRCPFEIVCTDDTSTDHTFERLEKWSARPEVHVQRHMKNCGGGAARNTCMEIAQGDLIFCLDSDNVLAPDSVQALIDHLDATNADVVAFGEVRYFEDDFILNGQLFYQCPNDEYTVEDIVSNLNSPPWSGNYLYTRKSFDNAGGYPVDYSALDTYAFGFRQVLTGAKMRHLPGTFYWHRVETNGYYVRERANKNLQTAFLRLILAHKEIFTDDTIKRVETQLRNAQKGRFFYDQNWFLENKMIKLKKLFLGANLQNFLLHSTDEFLL